MQTTAYPIANIGDGVYEIGEFDNGSMFLVIGEERALLIDCGMGVGNLKGALAKLTDKPITVAITHNHGDHIGHLPAFDEAYISPADMEGVANGGGIGMAREGRLQYMGFIAQRSGKTYDYDPDIDVVEWDASHVTLHPMHDGFQFDLGGRTVTAYYCIGHSLGSMVLIDDKSRILFLGDALNCNLLLGRTSVERSYCDLMRIKSMSDQYDSYYNGHSDYRAFGEPLFPTLLDETLEGLTRIMRGNYELTLVPSPLPIFPDTMMMVVGRSTIKFDENNIYDPR